MCSNYLNIQHPSGGLQTITQKEIFFLPLFFLLRFFTRPRHTACRLSLFLSSVEYIQGSDRKTVVDVRAEHLGSLVKKKTKKQRQQKKKKK